MMSRVILKPFGLRLVFLALGIALVLTLELGDWVDQEQPGTKGKLRNATVLVIVFFLTFFGCSLSRCRCFIN